MADDANLIESYLRGQLEKLSTYEEMERIIRELPDLVESVRSTELCTALPMLAAGH